MNEICSLCGKNISADTGYFKVNELTICTDCSIYSVAELYYKDKLKMYNSPDDVIEAEAVVSDVDDDEEKWIEEHMGGCIENCPLKPCNKCHYFYGELMDCMLSEPTVTIPHDELEKFRSALGDEWVDELFKHKKDMYEKILATERENAKLDELEAVEREKAILDAIESQQQDATE